MITQATLQSLIDIGFVMLVTYTCIKSLIVSNETKRSQWKTELKELETTLRSLIEEASLESNTLNRELLKRKQELLTLLQKIEQGTKKVKNVTAVEDDSLPNETWAVERKATSQKTLSASVEKVKQNITEPSVISSELVAHKVARRLLASGKEIHVVARKLDLPLAEVRQIERELREDVKSEREEYFINEFDVADRISLGNQRIV